MASEYEHPVFGPDRPLAAAQAYRELRAAEHAFKEHCHGWADHDSPEVRKRYRKAQDICAMYWEYGGDAL